MSETEPERTTKDAASTPVAEVTLPPMPGTVIDPELYRLTMTVVAQMDAMVTEYFAREGRPYTPYRSKRQVKAFDSGWPNVYSKEKDESRVDPSDLFAHKASIIDPFSYDDIPGMAALKAYVMGNDAILEKVRPQNAAGTVPDDLANSLLDTEIVLFANSIYDRATALDLDVTSAEVADLYLQREKSWLAPTLEYQLVVPLLLTDIDIGDEGLQIDEGTRIERLTDDDLRCITEVDRFTVMTPLADAAKWAVVVDMPPMENPGEGRSLFIRDAPIDTRGIDAVCDAIRIVSLARPGWARVFRRPKDWARHWEDNLPNLNHVFTARRYPAYFEDGGWLKTHTGVTADEAVQIPAVVAALKKSNAQAKLAARRLSMALLRDSPDDQLIDACIGLEARRAQKSPTASRSAQPRSWRPRPTSPADPNSRSSWHARFTSDAPSWCTAARAASTPWFNHRKTARSSPHTRSPYGWSARSSTSACYGPTGLSTTWTAWSWKDSPRRTRPSRNGTPKASKLQQPNQTPTARPTDRHNPAARPARTCGQTSSKVRRSSTQGARSDATHSE